MLFSSIVLAGQWWLWAAMKSYHANGKVSKSQDMRRSQLNFDLFTRVFG